MIDMQNIKLAKIIAFVLFSVGWVISAPISASAAEPVRVTVEGKPLSMPVPPVIVNDRTMIGVRAVGEAVGGTVNWDQAKRQAIVTRQGATVVMTLGKAEALVNGKPVALGVTAQLIGERTMVPLRFIAEALGGTVQWDDATRTANILRKPTAVAGMVYGKESTKATVTVSLSEAPIEITPRVLGNTLSFDLYPAQIVVDKPNQEIGDSLLSSLKLWADDRTVHLDLGLTAVPSYRFSVSPDGKRLTVELDYSVVDIHTAHDGRVTRVWVGTTTRPQFSTSTLLKTATSPNRLLVDIKGVHLAAGVPTAITVNDGNIQRVRSAQFTRDPDVVRVVLDMVNAVPPYDVVATDEGLIIQFMPQVLSVKAEKVTGGKTRVTLAGSLPMDAKVSLAPDKKQLRIEVPQGNSSVKDAIVKVGDGTVDTVSFAPGSTPGSLLITVALPYYLGHTVVSKDGDSNIVVDLISSPVYGKRIWIDAGHGQIPGGNDDPGTVGRTYKTQEDDVNLAVALELQKRLQDAGAKVYMTRTGSAGVDFRNRPKLVNAVKPPIDLFVSLHHNSATSTSVRGTETYYWTTNAKSKLAAQKIHAAVVKRLGFPDRGVRQDSFYVIKETLAPAVLVELGYLSNAVEEKSIGEPGAKVRSYPGKAADSVQAGIFDYFWQGIR